MTFRATPLRHTPLSSAVTVAPRPHLRLVRRVPVSVRREVMADPWQQSSGATRGTSGQFASLPQGPILGDLDGTYLGRLVVEAWQPNDPSMNDGLWYQGGPVGSPSEAMHLFQEMARQLDHALRHWSPSPLSHTMPQMAQMPAQGSNGGRMLGHLIVEAWRDADALCRRARPGRYHDTTGLCRRHGEPVATEAATPTRVASRQRPSGLGIGCAGAGSFDGRISPSSIRWLNVDIVSAERGALGRPQCGVQVRGTGRQI
jgi:hypothetical protein